MSKATNFPSRVNDSRYANTMTKYLMPRAGIKPVSVESCPAKNERNIRCAMEAGEIK